MKKKEEESIDNTLVTDVLIRVKTLENILVSKGLFTREEYYKEMEIVFKEITKIILQKREISKDLDQSVQELKIKSE